MIEEREVREALEDVRLRAQSMRALFVNVIYKVHACDRK